MAYINAEITADDIADLMNEDGEFMKDLFQVIVQRSEMGLLRDNLGDIAMNMGLGEADHLAKGLADLSGVVRSRFNMAHHDKQIYQQR